MAINASHAIEAPGRAAAHRSWLEVSKLLAGGAWLLMATGAHAGATTTTFASSSINPSAANQSTRFYATVSPNTATGTVTFKDGTTSLGSATVSNGVATLLSSFTTAGAHNLTAVYGGDANNTTSTSPVFVQMVGNANPLPALPAASAPVVTYEYDAQGNPTKTIQAPGVANFGFATVNTYDNLDRAKDTTDPKLGKTQFAYNGRTDVTQVTDPRNLVTQYSRDGLGQTTQVVSPDTGTRTPVTYDAAGNLKTSTDSRGVLSSYTYDALNRLTQVAHSKTGLTTQTYGWAYDQTGAGYANGVGRLTSSTHPNGSAQYTYDAQGRLTSAIQRVNATTGANASQITHTVAYGYTSGNLISITYPSGRKLTITYANGLATGVSLAKDAGTAATSLISQITRQPLGPVNGWQWQLSTTQAYGRVYDSSGRLVRHRLGTVIRDISYDAADRITRFTHYDAVTAAAQPSLDQTFIYDQNGRVTGVTANASSWTITYDANGNRTGINLNGSASPYTIAATSNRLSSIANPARSFGYDTAGNTTSDSAGYTATYDTAGRLATYTAASVTTTYAYNNEGRRVRKYSSSGASTTALFVYDPDGHLLGEYDSTGSALREYVWLDDTPVAMFTPDPAGSTNPPVVYYIHADHLNAPRVLVDKNNAVRWRWMSEPFGTTAPETNPTGMGAVTFPLRFPGQYADSESGLLYNHFRSYASTLGRYTQSDPIGLDGGINTYAYVGGNPLSFTDPNGLQAITAGDLARTLPAAGGVCAATGGTGCAAAAVGAVGVGSYWLTDRYVNPWAQPMIASAIDWCMAAASDTPTPQECDAEWLRARNVCFEWMNELGRPNISDRRRRQLLGITGGNMAICMGGQVSQACGGTKVEQPPKPRRKRYL